MVIDERTVDPDAAKAGGDDVTYGCEMTVHIGVLCQLCDDGEPHCFATSSVGIGGELSSVELR